MVGLTLDSVSYVLKHGVPSHPHPSKDTHTESAIQKRNFLPLSQRCRKNFWEFVVSGGPVPKLEVLLKFLDTSNR